MSDWFASHLRRLLWPLPVVLCALLALLAARGAPATDDEFARAARALARTQAWSVLLLLAPFFAARAAHAAHARNHAAWLAGGAPRARLAVGPVAAALCGAALLAGVLLASSESVLAGAAPVSRLLARPAGPAAVLHPHDDALEWHVARPPGARTARLKLALARGAAPSVQVVLELRDGAETRRLERRLVEGAALELALPPEETGTLSLRLTHPGEGALLVLDAHALELLGPARTERRAALVFALHAALALAALCALAQLCAQALGRGLAAALACALALLGARGGVPPWSDLVVAWGELARAREPAAPTWLGIGFTLALAALAAARLARVLRGGAP